MDPLDRLGSSWIVLDRLGLSLVQSLDNATIAAVLPP